MDLFPQHSELIRAIRKGDINTAKSLLEDISVWAKHSNLGQSQLYVDYIECAIDRKNINILAIILRALKTQASNYCASNLLFTPTDQSYNFIERALLSDQPQSAKLLVYFSQNLNQKNILSNLDRLINSAKFDITPSNDDWYKYIDAMVQKRKKSKLDLLAQKAPDLIRERRFIIDIYTLYSKAYRQGVLTFKLMQCKLQSAYAFLYKIENEYEEYLKPKMTWSSRMKEEVTKNVLVGVIGDTCFPIDALPSDLLNLVFKALTSPDILALYFVSKGTLKALNHLDSHYHIWKVQYNRQKYHPPSDKKLPENTNSWRTLVVKENRISSNWRRGKFEVNYLTPAMGRQMILNIMCDNWMLFRPQLTTKVNNWVLWNSCEQRMWSTYSGGYDTRPSAVFVDEGAYNKPPIIAVGLGIPNNIMMFKDREQILTQIRLPSPTSKGLEYIDCYSDNKLYGKYGYMDIGSELFVEFPTTLELLNIQSNIFNDRMMYGLNKSGIWQLMDNRDHMNIVQQLQVPGMVTFVDEHLFLSHVTDVRYSPKLTLFDLRKFDSDAHIAQVNADRTDTSSILDLKSYRVAVQIHDTFHIYRSNTLEKEGQWSYEGDFEGLSGRYAVGSIHGRSVALDFAI